MSADSITSIIGDYPYFLTRIFYHLEALNLDVGSFELDHVCYRVNSLEQYEEKKSQLLNFGALLTEADVSGRPIATFKLNEPLMFAERKIYLIEVPAPKVGKYTLEGLEHVEFVAGEDLLKIQSSNPHLPWDDSGLKKKNNPELELDLGDGLAVKFHPRSLETVIAEELASITSK